MKDYKFHPLCELFPVMELAELDKLGADIKANGQRQKIVLFDGKILDGRNRYLACKMAGVEAKFETLKGKNLKAIVCSLNIFRRHLTDAQRAMLAAEIATLEQGETKSAGPIGLPAAAAAVQVSERSAKRAKVVKEEGTKDLNRAVKSGKVKLDAAAKVARLPKSEQRKLKTPKAIKEKAAELRSQPRGGLRNNYGDGRVNTDAYVSTPGAWDGKPEAKPLVSVSSALAKAELLPVTDAESAIARLRAAYELNKEWFNRLPQPAPREILEKYCEALR